ncbi:glycoside hydrolase family 13 protein [Frigoribacterium faeni]|uniref:glycoside hydrolase family 13 protein n=1 Tax=Frigoribacterium faeni TaxID=145483 RepID=UPI001FAB53FD|nr:glycoside hydrolase family 13 protein [Frigoribacterium faeni]MCJ0702082.1 glycoside hydrolase family 13 protein [Frigoribacterium faeni]
MTDSLQTTPTTELLTDDPTWWRQAAVYQIYPRSFADSNGDGIGDLPGITAKVPYLTALGVDAVWLSPFYPSALADGGYDVDDYRDVDPKIGTLAQFDEMITALHGAGIKVIVDLVPNHSSDRHVWFQEALAAPAGSPARARYIFRDGLGEDGELPPSDWTSIFGGPAWTRVADGQWYLHSFASEQPDWDWDNEEVREDFLTTLRFWSDRGVDGFRVDVAHGLAKSLPEVLPSKAELDALPKADGDHPVWDRDEVHEIYATWREVFDSYDPPRTAVAEAWVEPSRRARYASAEGLGQAFNFDLLEADFDATAFHDIITYNLKAADESGSSTTWVFSNHDVVRHPTRYGLPPLAGREIKQGAEWLLAGGDASEVDAERGLRRARAASLFMLGLPGSAYVYQGEELGLPEVGDIPEAQRQDPAFFRNPGVDVGRDGCRVPLPWERTGESFGFGPGPAHLPQPTWFRDFSVEAEEGDPTSTLSLYRAALAARRELQTDETLTWEAVADTGAVAGAEPQVLHFSRPGGWHVVCNFGPTPVAMPTGEVLVASGPLGDAGEGPGSGADAVLPGETAVWLRA